MKIVDGAYPDNVKLTVDINNDDEDHLNTINFTVSDEDGSALKISAREDMSESRLHAVDKIVEIAISDSDLREAFEMNNDILPKLMSLIEAGEISDDDIVNEFYKMVSEKYEIIAGR